MSVINKMLRDLDQRQAHSPGGGSTPHAQWAGATVALDKASSDSPTPRSVGMRPVVGAMVLVMLLGAAGWWGWQYLHSTAPEAVPVPGGGAAPAASAPVVAAAPLAGPAAEAPRQGGAPAEEQTMQLRMESQLSAQNALDALLTTPPPPPLRANSSASAVSAPVEVATSAPSAKHPVSRPVPTTSHASAAVPNEPKPTSSAASTPLARRTQLTGSEALAQAQALWNSGAADAAIEMVASAMAVAERNVRSGSEAIGNPQLLTLVREWTRMQLAGGRYGAVWEGLTRLEPVLGNVPDLLALRANAAQRIGRHQDSVQSYLAALQARPDEQRWLLGAAVSLAALGQTTSAAELVDKARALGPINKSIAAYLRQSGVPLHE